MTKYLVLEQMPMKEAAEIARSVWGECAEVEATSARAAIRSYLGDDGKKGEFVAVPSRSFKPVTVKVETQTKLTFS